MISNAEVKICSLRIWYQPPDMTLVSPAVAALPTVAKFLLHKLIFYRYDMNEKGGST